MIRQGLAQLEGDQFEKKQKKLVGKLHNLSISTNYIGLGYSKKMKN